MEYPLANKWNVWEHRNDQEKYEDNLVFVTSFSDVPTFWNIFHHLPHPGDFFFGNRKPRCLIGNRSVVSYSIFKDGIIPKWEDPVANAGGEWRIRRFKNLDELDRIWEDITCLVVGNTLENTDNILGVRVVDSSHPDTNKAMYNVEIWFDDMKHSEPIKNSIGENILELDVSKMYLRNHAT